MMINLVNFSANLKQQRGSALIIALVFLLAMTMIGVAAMRDTTQQESMAGNTRQRNLAFQVSEAGLRSAEQFLKNPPASVSLIENTFANNTGGLYQLNNTNRPIWVGGTTSSGNGACSGSPCPVYSGKLTQKPEYFIEALAIQPPAEAGIAVSDQVAYFRITSRGFGDISDAIVVLRSIYRVR